MTAGDLSNQGFFSRQIYVVTNDQPAGCPGRLPGPPPPASWASRQTGPSSPHRRTPPEGS